MTPEEYLQKYSGSAATYCASLATPCARNGGVTGAIVQFNEETACCWGGPFEGDYAACIVNDYRNATYGKAEPYNLLPYKEWRERCFKDSLKLASKYKYNQTHIYNSPEDVLVDWPTLEYPVALKCYGNDDTSYTKFFATVDEAVEMLRLLEANQPLDFNKDFLPLGFIFTN